MIFTIVAELAIIALIRSKISLNVKIILRIIMSSEMIIHVTLSVKLQLAHWAAEGFLACVNAHVGNHISLVGEHSPADFASKINS